MAFSTNRLINDESSFRADLRFVRRMNGSSQSILVRDSADRLWVLKVRSGQQGPNALANEIIGTQLCQSLGLPVPEVKALKVGHHFFADERTWLQTTFGSERPKSGLHLASRYFPDFCGQEAVEILPPTLRSLLNRKYCLGMFLFDVWAAHADSRQALYFVDGRQMSMIFIDHGHLFGGPHWLHEQCYIGGRLLQRCAVEDAENRCHFDEWIRRMEAEIPPAFESAVSLVPGAWHTGDISRLRHVFTLRLKQIRALASEAIRMAHRKIEVMHASEQRLADSPIRILSERGTDAWL